MRRSLAASLKSVSVLQVPINLGQPSLGLDKAPGRIIENGLTKVLGDIGWRWRVVPPLIDDAKYGRDFRSYEDINAKNCMQVGTVSEIVRNEIVNECSDGSFPLILGGDHCISIGTISGLKKLKKDSVVIWVDAHGDINTPLTSLSGNMHGMPVAFLMGLVPEVKTLPGFQWFEPVLDPKDIVYIGLRDLDKAEKMTIKKLGIKAFTMHDIDRMGIGQVMEETLKYIGNRPIHLSFDIDAIDPFFAPHTGTAVTGGITFREGNYLCEAIAATGNLSSMEVVEVDPSQHKDMSSAQTIDVALTLIGSAMGAKIL